MHVLDMLKERGFVAQVTFEDDLYKALEREPMTFYLGIDPTADSLHVGHFMPIIVAGYLQRAGHRPIILCGGGTAMIGDPSGKSDLRKMMSRETIGENVCGIQKQLSRFLDFSEGKAIMVNNGDWLLNLNYIDFLREVGALFSVNRMLTAECYKRRMETGLTFLEFNYMLMQSYDFLQLFKNYGCRLQIGGDDQWSNMLSGADLIRRKEHEDAFALTCKLIMTHDGKKMGKTEKGALWLDPARTTPFEFYQYWRNVDDADVLKCIRMLTFLPLEEIDKMDSWQGEQLNKAKEILAYELTKMVHGEAEADQAQAAAKAVFGGSGEGVPTVEITKEDGNDILSLLVKSGLCASKSDARRNVQQGGVTANDSKVTDIAKTFTEAELRDGVVLKRGKKNFRKMLLK